MGILQTIANKLFPAPVNKYEGAGQSLRRSYLDTSYTSARFDVTSSTRQAIVRKSRFFEQNNAVLNRLGDLFESYTVGSSFSVQPASSDPAWNLKAKKWFDVWSRYPDIGSRQSFATLMSQAARGWFFDGESFILLTKGESGKPRLQLIEAQSIATPAGMEADQTVFDGIRFDPKTGRAISYFIGSEKTQGNLTDVRSIGSDSVVHIYEPNRPGQLRGLPFVSAVINDLHDLDDLQKLEMEACKLGASVAQIVKTVSGEVQASSLRSGGISQTTQNTAENYYEQVFGSSVKVLKNGDSFEQFATERPGVNMREYWRQLTEKVCAGVGIPYVLVYPESMQGTVYRGALDMSAVWFKSRHQVMSSAARRIYEYVMEYAIKSDPALNDAPSDWYEVAITAPRSPNVDVGRNSAAQLAELEAGILTYDEVYGARGLDWRSALEAKAQQALFIRELAGKYGLRVSEVSTIQEDRPERIKTEPTIPQPPEPSPSDSPAPVAPSEGGAVPVVEETIVTANAKKTRKPKAKKTE
jgi:lambda family phage portal protein